jgi:acyl-CoA thioesterase I
MTGVRSPRCSVPLVAAAVGLASLLMLPAGAPAQTSPRCAVSSELGRFDRPLSHIAQRIALGKPVKIVAIGSSSTAGSGASSIAFSYPSQLEVELKARFPQLSITVLNRGIGGEEAAQMLARFAEVVIAEKPDLVLWQVGTNAVLRDHDVMKVIDVIREGLGRLKAIGADVILIDPQFAPRVIEKGEAKHMVELMAAAAERENVDLFRRFGVMRYWNGTRHISFQQSIGPDGLHMNDWSYGCMAKLLANAITDASTRVPQSSGIPLVPTAQR